MRRPRMHYIQDLSTKDVKILTQLLYLSPNSSPTSTWLHDQANKIKRLPKALLKPASLFPRFAVLLPFAKEKACLCEAHKRLHPYLIRRIFLQVSVECTRRVARLEENLQIPTDLSAFLKRIHSVNSLWMAPDMYRTLYNTTPYDSRYERVESGCEACILASVGGNPQILSDLRTSMLGRKKKRVPVARLLRLVDAWIEGAELALFIRENSDILSREVREYRRQLQLARRQTRRNINEGILDPDTKKRIAPNATGSAGALLASTGAGGGDEDDDSGYDFEDSVINEYLTRYSRSALALERPQPSDIHPAFRNSVFYDRSSGTFVRKGKMPETPREPQRSQSELTHCTQWPAFNQSRAPRQNAKSGQAQQTLMHPSATQALGGSSTYCANTHSKENVSTSRASSEEWAKDYRELLISSPDSDKPTRERANWASEPADGSWM